MRPIAIGIIWFLFWAAPLQLVHAEIFLPAPEDASTDIKLAISTTNVQEPDLHIYGSEMLELADAKGACSTSTTATNSSAKRSEASAVKRPTKNLISTFPSLPKPTVSYSVNAHRSGPAFAGTKRVGQNILDPSIKGVLGPLTVEARGQLFFEEHKKGKTQTDSPSKFGFDAKQWALRVGYDLGASNIGVGYARADRTVIGQTGPSAGKLDSNQLIPFLILPGAAAANGGAGKVINNATSGQNISVTGEPSPQSILGIQGQNGLNQKVGYNVVYAYGAFSPLENVTLSATIGFANGEQSDKSDDNTRQKVDAELDLGAKIRFGRSITYDVAVGFMGRGDSKQLMKPSNLQDETWSVMNSLKLTF